NTDEPSRRLTWLSFSMPTTSFQSEHLHDLFVADSFPLSNVLSGASDRRDELRIKFALQPFQIVIVIQRHHNRGRSATSQQDDLVILNLVDQVFRGKILRRDDRLHGISFGVWKL